MKYLLSLTSLTPLITLVNLLFYIELNGQNIYDTDGILKSSLDSPQTRIITVDSWGFKYFIKYHNDDAFEDKEIIFSNQEGSI